MIGATLQNRYRLDAVLGQGGMGELYRAFDLLLQRDVAIKLLNDRGLGSKGRARLLHEAQSAARLDHPNIVTIYDASEADGRPFIVMQLVEGKSLQELHPTNLDEILPIMRQVCAALEHAHTHGVIHRDLKPENVLITPEGLAKLSDFGLARSSTTRLSSEGLIVGTVFYMAPEQALGEEIDGRADLYSLGVMLYELIAERLPFSGDDPIAVISQHLYAPVVPPSTYNQKIPPALDTLILRLLSKRPADRPASAAETARLLEAIQLPEIEALPERPALAGLSILDRIARGRLVGRQVELAQIHELWTYAQQGNSHLVLISGEPGVGKTRLAREILIYARLDQAAIFQAACYEYEATTPFLPFAEALRDWASRRATDVLREELGSTAFELSRLAPEIEVRLGPLAPSPALPPNEERLRMFDNVARFLQKLARKRGLLLFIDDLHWADNGTLALLSYLLRRLRGERLLALAAYREVELDRSRPLSDALVEWNRERLATRLALGRLTIDSCRAMIAGLFGLESISDEFTELIFHETEGNPFFIEEVLKSLIEQGQIYREEDRWERKEIADLTVPQSVREAIGRRLNRLSKTCLDALHVAAAIGKTFQFVEIVAVADMSEETLLDALDEASLAQLISSEPSEGFTFTHDKIREVLYEELNPIRRRRLHQRIGEGLLRLYGSQIDQHAAELAHHFIESGDLENGLRFAMAAARGAEKIYAHDEALFYYVRAAECAEGLNLPGQRLVIEEATADIYYRTGPFELAVEHYQRAIDLAPEAVKRIELGIKIGATYANIGDERGVAYLKAALDEKGISIPVEGRARALAMLGRYYHYHGHGEQAIEYLEQARELAEPLAGMRAESFGSVELLTEIYAYLSGAYQWWGGIEHSNEWARGTLTLGEKMNYPNAIALGYEFLAENAAILNRWQESLQNAIRDKEIGEKIGSQDRVAWGEMSTTFAYQGMGDLKSALAAANRGIALAQSSGNIRLEILLRSRRAQIYSDMDDEHLMQADIDFLLVQADRMQQYQVYEWTYQTLCYIHAYRRDWLALPDIVDKYEELTRRAHPSWLISAYLGVKDLQALAKFRDEFLRLADDPETGGKGHYWILVGRYRDLTGEFDLAEQAFERSIRIYEAEGSRLELGRAYAWRAELYSHYDRDGLAQADFETAKRIFDECGATLDLVMISN